MSELTGPRPPTIASENRAAMTAWILLPVVTLVMLFFGSGRIPPCLGGWRASGCPIAYEPGALGLVATADEVLWTVVAFILAWLASGVWLLRALQRAGHPAVLEVVRTTFVAGIVFGLAGLMHGLIVGQRLRTGAETAILLGSVGVLLAWEFRLLWLVTRRATSR